MLVYTAVIGEAADQLLDPTRVFPGIRYICYTDRLDVKSGAWEIQRVNVPQQMSPRLFSRWLKILCPEWDNFGASLWLDADFQLRADPRIIARRLLQEADMLTFRHPRRDCIEDEAEAIAALDMAPIGHLRSQVARYRETWPRHRQKQITSSGFMLRRHSDRVRRFSEAWWQELLDCGHERDQMSVDFVANQHEIQIAYLRGDYANNRYAAWRPSGRHGMRTRLRSQKREKRRQKWWNEMI